MAGDASGSSDRSVGNVPATPPSESASGLGSVPAAKSGIVLESSTAAAAAAPELPPDAVKLEDFLGWAKTRSKEELAHQLHRLLKLLVTLRVLDVRVPFARERLLLENGPAAGGGEGSPVGGDEALEAVSPSAIACLALNPALCPPQVSPLLSIPLFSDLGRYERHFDELACIGKGAFGAVFSARHKLDRVVYAIKKVKIKPRNPRFPIERLLNLDVGSLAELESVRQLLREVTSLARVDHPNCVRYHGAWIEPMFDCPGRREGEAGRAGEGSTWAVSETATETRPRGPWTEPSRKSASRRLERSTSLRVEVLPDSERASSRAPPGSPPEASATASVSGSGRGLFAVPRGGLAAQLGPDESVDWSESGHPAAAEPPPARPGEPPARAHSAGDVAELRRQLAAPASPPSPASPSTPPGPLAIVPAGPRRPSSLVPRPVGFVLFIQMALCEGKTLHQWIADRNRRGSVEREACMRLFVQLMQGVAHIHAQRIVHRDIKPANLFLQPTGLLKIGDFGLSTDLQVHGPPAGAAPPAGAGEGPGASSRRTRDVGTPSYAPPETRVGAFSEASDIFSCGIVLLELFCVLATGMERARVLAELREASLPSSLLRDWPLEASLVLWMTKPSPRDRPSAITVLEQLTCVWPRRALPAAPAALGTDAEGGGPEGGGRTVCEAALRDELERRGRRIADLEEEVARLKAQIAATTPPGGPATPPSEPPASPLVLPLSSGAGGAAGDGESLSRRPAPLFVAVPT